MMIALLFLASWAAFTVSAIAGGGAGLVLVPLLRTIVAIESVPAALSIGTAVSSLSRIALLRRSIRWDVVRRFVPTALPAAGLGAWLLTRFEPAYVELVLALFLLANLPALLRRRSPESPPAPIAPGRLPWVGALAGLISGFTGAVGLLFNGVYRRLGMTPEEIVATRATNEVLLHLLKLALYAGFGLLDRPALVAGALVALAAVVASLSARWLLPRMPEATFRRIGQGAMVAAGAVMFSLSSGELMRLHRAWVALVSPGDEHELHFYWRGRPRIALEAEDDGWPVIERTVAFATLPADVRRRALAAVPAAAITQVESVHGLHGRSYEVYFKREGRAGKIELDHPAPGPRRD